jgi:uncharacterized protein YceK
MKNLLLFLVFCAWVAGLSGCKEVIRLDQNRGEPIQIHE